MKMMKIATLTFSAACLSIGCSGGSKPEAPPGPRGSLVIVTERESPEVAMHYLHLIEDWPATGELDYESALEIGVFPNVAAHGGAVYVHQPEDATVRKLVVDDSGAVTEDEVLSFAGYGVTGFDAEIIYASRDRAFLVDEASGQIITWDPEAMDIIVSTPIDDDILERDGLPVQLQQGVVAGGRAFTAVNWRNWDTFEYRELAAMGMFDASRDDPELAVLEDERCAPSVGLSPFVGEDETVYLVSDAALGFDALASSNPTDSPLCVLRVKPGASEFDPEFFLDLREATGSPGFYAAHPMRDERLLVNVWAGDTDPASVASPEDSSWYWDYPPYFEYVIVDLETGTSTPVPGLPRAAVQFSKTLRVDDTNYVQLYRDDGGSVLSRVDPDGTVSEVLTNGTGTDVQYIGRITR